MSQTDQARLPAPSLPTDKCLHLHHCALLRRRQQAAALDVTVLPGHAHPVTRETTRVVNAQAEPKRRAGKDTF